VLNNKKLTTSPYHFKVLDEPIHHNLTPHAFIQKADAWSLLNPGVRAIPFRTSIGPKSNARCGSVA
jgi:hypothetical protein